MSRHHTDDKPFPELDHATQLTASSGLVVDLDHYCDVERENRGWVVDRIEARVDGKPAGYLQLSYIPAEEWDRRYPTAFEYMASKMTGKYGTIRNRIDEQPDDTQWDRDVLLKVIENSFSWMHGDQRDELDALSDDELYRLWTERKEMIRSSGEAEYKDTRAYTRDSPVVDFIRVYDQYETNRPLGGVEQHVDKKRLRENRDTWHQRNWPVWQRQGIGTVLYEAGAMWMAERGMHMHASSVQTDHAQGAWKHLEAKHAVHSRRMHLKQARTYKQRRYLDGHEVAQVLGLELNMNMQQQPDELSAGADKDRPLISHLKRAASRTAPGSHDATIER